MALVDASGRPLVSPERAAPAPAGDAAAGPITVTQDSFVEIVKNEGIVLLDWWASWCGPCRAFAPVFEAAAAANPDIVFGKVDTESEPSLAQAFRIRSIPTLMAFRDGILLFAQPGMLPAHALADLIRQLRALDMDEVRRQIAAEAANESATKGEEDHVHS
jgi:thioredoxin 1